MSLLVETIRFSHGLLHNKTRHQERFNRSRNELFNANALELTIPIPDNLKKNATYKVRVLYSHKIEKIEWHIYTPRKLTHFEIVENNEIDYSYKYTNRDEINRLCKKSQADTIIILKNGMITDSAFANLLFFDGTSWITPSTPLLQGTMREYLLQVGMIQDTLITKDDLHSFSKFKLINAMLPFEESEEYPISNITNL